jgi:hypothetical protein
MEEAYTTQKLIALRKLTRNIGEIICGQMKDYIGTLTPLFRQRAVLGDHIQGFGKEPAPLAEKAFAELQTLYGTIATAAPFHLPRELKTPLMQMTQSLELTPWEYPHIAQSDRESKTITVTSPFKSIVTYAGYTPQRLKDLLANRNRNTDELLQFVLHYLAMHVVISKQPGLTQLLSALHIEIAASRLPEFGALPITYIASSVSTGLPPDAQLIETAELSGKDAFEELVNVSDIRNLQDPLREKLSVLTADFA